MEKKENVDIVNDSEDRLHRSGYGLHNIKIEDEDIDYESGIDFLGLGKLYRLKNKKQSDIYGIYEKDI